MRDYMKIIPEGEQLINRWQTAKQRLKNAKDVLGSAECELSNSTIALAKFLLPSDAKPGEKYCVWFGDALISAEIPLEGRDAKVEIRKRGESLM